MSFDQFLHLSTPAISDALDILGVQGVLQGIGMVTGTSRGLIIGPAYTVQFQPVADGAAAPAADFIDEVPPGSIVVLANDGRLDCTVWGGILTHCAKNRALRGTVIDGICRDIETIRSSAYPVYARGVGIRSGKNRARMIVKQGVVQIASIPVSPGDLVCGDENGVLILPHSRALEIFQHATTVHDAESGILDFCKLGWTLREARKKFNYDQLALPTKKT